MLGEGGGKRERDLVTGQKPLKNKLLTSNVFIALFGLFLLLGHPVRVHLSDDRCWGEGHGCWLINRLHIVLYYNCYIDSKHTEVKKNAYVNRQYKLIYRTQRILCTTAQLNLTPHCTHFNS